MTNLIDRILAPLMPKRERLLIVENEPPLLDLFSKFFSERGYSVAIAQSLSEAEAKLASEKFDLVLQDVILDDGDGIEFIPQIKRLQPDAAVIILTSLGHDESIVKEAIQKGAAGYASKLLPLDQVLMEIRRATKYKTD